jgi:hypothetical protein
MAHAPGGVKVQVFDNQVEAAPEDPQGADVDGRVLVGGPAFFWGPAYPYWWYYSLCAGVARRAGAACVHPAALVLGLLPQCPGLLPDSADVSGGVDPGSGHDAVAL